MESLDKDQDIYWNNTNHTIYLDYSIVTKCSELVDKYEKKHTKIPPGAGIDISLTGLSRKKENTNERQHT